MKRTAAFDIYTLIQAVNAQVGHLLNHEHGWYAGETCTPTFSVNKRYLFATKDDVLHAQLTQQQLHLALVPTRSDGLVDLAQLNSPDPIYIFEEDRKFKLRWDARDAMRQHWITTPSIKPAVYELVDAMIMDTMPSHSGRKSRAVFRMHAKYEELFNHDLVIQELINPTSKYFRFDKPPERTEILDRHVSEAIISLVTRLFELNDPEFLKIIHFMGEGLPGARYVHGRSGNSIFVQELASQMEECWNQWQQAGMLGKVIEYAEKLVQEKEAAIDRGTFRSPHA